MEPPSSRTIKIRAPRGDAEINGEGDLLVAGEDEAGTRGDLLLALPRATADSSLALEDAVYNFAEKVDWS
jgi:hypothetical protein